MMGAKLSGASPQGGRTYSPRSTTNCKPKAQRGEPQRVQRRGSERERKRLNRSARQAHAHLLAGMEYPSWFVTLTRGHCLDLTLRRDAWHMLLTRLRQEWPDVEAHTTYEYGHQRRGVHLHVIIKRAPGLTQDWLDHMMALLGDGTEAQLAPIDRNSEFLARYLTKQLTDRECLRQWPRYFRPTSCTRGWCPDWVPDRPSSAAARRPSPRKNGARPQAPRDAAGDNGTPNDDMDEPE